MPVSWYSERDGFWAMSPGYDRPAHLDFRRLIAEDCMSCHNGYPRGAVQDDGNGPKFPEPLPEGIDCQRCHGPGQAHVDAIKANDLEAGRRAIANPATFDRERQLETCMQCHLETTSSPLPFQIRRYERPPFSYTPGEPLGDYFIHFDHAPGAGREDKFEIAGGAYRLRKSACFQRSDMTCTTCHDPHDIPRGAKAVQHYVAVCQSCHQSVHRTGVPQVRGVAAGATCLDCHMPKRRAEDAVHVVMTDHRIQRHRPAEDLLAPRSEADNFEHGGYRGEVVVYYPPKLPPTPENELYVALAQVQQGSNLTAGIPRLEQAIEKYRPERADFYFELARAYSKTSNYDADIRWCEEALRRDPNFTPALKELAAAATATGRLAQAAQALEKAVALRPRDSDAFADLGNVYLQQDRVEDALRALQQALSLDASMPQANNTMGLAALRRGDAATSERYFREAIRHQPDLAEAQNNLGNLLAGRRSYAEAGYYFEKAIRSNPEYVEARHSYGMVLALAGDHAGAVAQLQAAARLAPRLAQVHTDLGDVLAAMGRADEAVREYELAIQLDPNDEGARLGLAALRASGR
jgi:tetratricopeptide (TPR) repeat protein